MEESYKISRIIIGIGAVIISYILIGNQGGLLLVIPWIFGLIAYGISFISSGISKKIIQIEKNIKSKYMKILFYILLPIAILGLFIFILNCIIFPISYVDKPNTTDIGVALSNGFFYLFIKIVVFIGVILPYVQTLLVLILNYFRKIK